MILSQGKKRFTSTSAPMLGFLLAPLAPRGSDLAASVTAAVSPRSAQAVPARAYDCCVHRCCPPSPRKSTRNMPWFMLRNPLDPNQNALFLHRRVLLGHRERETQKRSVTPARPRAQGLPAPSSIPPTHTHYSTGVLSRTGGNRKKEILCCPKKLS